MFLMQSADEACGVWDPKVRWHHCPWLSGCCVLGGEKGAGGRGSCGHQWGGSRLKAVVLLLFLGLHRLLQAPLPHSEPRGWGRGSPASHSPHTGPCRSSYYDYRPTSSSAPSSPSPRHQLPSPPHPPASPFSVSGTTGLNAYLLPLTRGRFLAKSVLLR